MQQSQIETDATTTYSNTFVISLKLIIKLGHLDTWVKYKKFGLWF